MKKPPRYSVVIQWSEDDQAYLATLPEWEGRVYNPVTHGDTYEEAFKNALEVLRLLIEVARELGQPLPEPNVLPSGTSAA